MRSRSTSRSEGEYLSSDPETQATKPPTHRNDYRVNRHARHYSSARPRRSRSRSRSPYRASRGEKRRREDDHRPSKNDPRTFTVRYEDNRNSGIHSHGDRTSKRSRTFSPSRSRSRSPFRHDKVPDKVEEETQNKQLVSTHDQRSDGVPQIEDIAKPVEQSQNVQDLKQASEEYARFLVWVDPANIHSDVIETPAPAILDEAAIIEARRKRREAIKNQYRGQAPSLLVRALHPGTDTPADSPNASSNRSGKLVITEPDSS